MKLANYIRLIVATLSLGLAPCAANAAYIPLTCSSGGGGVSVGTMYDDTAVCRYTDIQHIFSMIVCNFVRIINDIMDNVYCSLQYGLQSTLAVLLTLYIAIFGVQILMGTAQLSSGEIVVRILKICGVWMFCTQSTWAINLALGFFLSVATEGVMWVTNPIMGTSDVSSVYAFLDNFIYEFTVGTLLQANAKLIGFFIVMGATVPSLAAMALYWLWTTLMTLGSTLLSFISSLAAIAFLISMSPFFVSFLLFRATYHLFEGWLKYMMSYSLRIVIVFAILTMWLLLMSRFIGFFNELADMVFPYEPVLFVGGEAIKPEHVWGICPPQYGSDAYGPTAGCGASECASAGVRSFDPADCPEDITEVVGPAEIIKKGMFLYFVFYHLTALVMISYAFKQMMKHADSLADAIVGPAFVPTLGPGWSTLEGMNQGMTAQAAQYVDNHSGNTMVQHASRAVSDFVGRTHQQVGKRP